MNGIREPLSTPEPQEISRRPRPLDVKHPGLNFPLFRFPAFSTGSPTTPYGVSRLLVLDACRVITNQAANGQGDFLSTDLQGQDRLEIDDTPLDVHCYYFLGTPEVEANCDYPIVKTLSAFRFPSVLPAHWARIAERRPPRPYDYPSPLEPSQMPNLVQLRDQVCTIMQSPDAAQCTHLIPKSKEAWFLANRMDVDYIGNSVMRTGNIDHPANGMLLRADVRRCFNSHAFVFYPVDGANGDDTFMAYFVGGGYRLLPDLFHRRRVAIPQDVPGRDPQDVPVEFLYARFAHTIINLQRYDLGFHSVPELPMVEVMRGRIRERGPEMAQEAFDASGEGSDEESEDEGWDAR